MSAVVTIVHAFNMCLVLLSPFFCLGGWPSADWGENWPGGPLFGNLHVRSQDIHWHPQPNPESRWWPQSLLLFQPSHLGQQTWHWGWHSNENTNNDLLIKFLILRIAGTLQKRINSGFSFLDWTYPGSAAAGRSKSLDAGAPRPGRGQSRRGHGHRGSSSEPQTWRRAQNQSKYFFYYPDHWNHMQCLYVTHDVKYSMSHEFLAQSTHSMCYFTTERHPWAEDH